MNSPVDFARTVVVGAATSLKARADFFAAWKDADSDLPILIEAKRDQAETPFATSRLSPRSYLSRKLTDN